MTRLLPALLALIFSLATVAANAQEFERERAQQLWEQVIAAKGGRERLYAVSNLVVSSKTKNIHPTKDFPGHHFESLFVLSDKWWFWADERPGFGITIWTYDFGRQVGQETLDVLPEVRTYRPAQSPSELVAGSKSAKDDATYQFAKGQFIEWQVIYLMETKWLQPTRLRAWTERFYRKKVSVVEVSHGRERFEFYLDGKTHLPVQVILRTRIEAMGRDYEDGYVLGDYVEVGGIQFPSTVRRGGEKNETTYQVNVAYDADIFERPPVIEAGPEAWKKK
ncbi:MAG: hypothetical protein M3444_08865 [Acidobacteriota bacterium]|nr:hypothetical protein [Acidobacteriota bacterium]MDQ5838119.1 hypothetical protein [Acidobacteriota bacterium]